MSRVLASGVLLVIGATACGCAESHGTVDAETGMSDSGMRGCPPGDAGVSEVLPGVEPTTPLWDLSGDEAAAICEWELRLAGSEMPVCADGTTRNFATEACLYTLAELRRSDMDCERTLQDHVEWKRLLVRRCFEGAGAVDSSFFACVTRRNMTRCGDMP